MPAPTATPMPFNLLRAMDAVCDTFDGAWYGGQRPEIDRFLPQVEEAVRPLLVEELVRAELEWRCRQGEHPSTQEYAGRYPGCRDKLETWLAEARASTQTWNPATDTISPAPTLEPFLPAAIPPPVLGEYDLLAMLGRGGMGEVWKARHRRLDKLVALKRLSSNRLCDAGARARFLQEMRAVGRLDHPNLIEAHDAGEHEGTVYLVMKLVEGQDLARLLHERGSLPVSQACELMRQTALGLQYLHEHGLVHRDLKPSNLIRSPDGTVKILDFGLARLRLDGPADDLTPDGLVMGTPDYVAPEQIVGAAAVDVRTDLYSLGATLFHLLAGQPPFADREGVWPKLDAHRLTLPPNLRRLRPEVPAALADLVARLLAKRPEDRLQTPAEVVAALAAFTAVPPEPPRPPRPWRRLFVAAACAATAALLFAVIVIIRDKQGKTVARIEIKDSVVEGGDVKVIDQKTGKTTQLPLPTPDPKPPQPAPLKDGDRVTLIEEVITPLDEPSGKQSDQVGTLKKGTAGKVLKIDNVNDLCQIRLDKPKAGVEVWVPLSKVKVTK